MPEAGVIGCNCWRTTASRTVEPDGLLFWEPARQDLLHRGVEASELMEFSPDDGGTFFSDPDGDTWTVQQLKVRGEKPLIPEDHRGRFGA